MKGWWLVLIGLGMAACQSTSPDSTSPSSSASPSSTLAQSPESSAVSPSPTAVPSTVAPTPTITASPPASPATTSTPTIEPADPSADSTVDPSIDPSAGSASALPSKTVAVPESTVQPLDTYRQPDGLFEVSLPPGYTYREIEDGVSFISGDRRFGGSVNVVSAEGRSLTNELLEEGLKEEYAGRLQSVQWQASTPQPDGSLRIDWIGVDTNDDVLDSVSFVEQHGDYIYILNLHAINEAYANHEAAATTIVENYRLRFSE